MNAPAVDLAQRRLERWTETAVGAVLDELRATTGGRNAALVSAASRLGTFVRYRLIDEATAERELLAAAEANGYLRKDGLRTARGTIRRGLRHGYEHGTVPYEIEELARGWTPPAAPGEPAEPLPPIEAAPLRPPPPPDEVADLWGRARSVLDDAGARAWLTERRIDAIAVDERDLARALPAEGPLPPWAARWLGDDAPSWRESGHRLLVPLYDARGELRSVLARDVTGRAERKSLATAGHGRRELVMADAYARRVLARRPPYARVRLVVAEGERKFLRTAAGLGEAAEGVAVLAIDSGSWPERSAALADAVPNGATVVIRTDPDAAGAGYATKIIRSLADRWRRAHVAVELRDAHELALEPDLHVRLAEEPAPT